MVAGRIFFILFASRRLEGGNKNLEFIGYVKAGGDEFKMAKTIFNLG